MFVRDAKADMSDVAVIFLRNLDLHEFRASLSKDESGEYLDGKYLDQVSLAQEHMNEFAARTESFRVFAESVQRVHGWFKALCFVIAGLIVLQ